MDSSAILPCVVLAWLGISHALTQPPPRSPAHIHKLPSMNHYVGHNAHCACLNPSIGHGKVLLVHVARALSSSSQQPTCPASCSAPCQFSPPPVHLAIVRLPARSEDDFRSQVGWRPNAAPWGAIEFLVLRASGRQATVLPTATRPLSRRVFRLVVISQC
jgi:hypothetical protein